MPAPTTPPFYELFGTNAEATNARVAWFSIGSLVVCMVLAAWQLWYLKVGGMLCLEALCIMLWVSSALHFEVSHPLPNLSVDLRAALLLEEEAAVTVVTSLRSRGTVVSGSLRIVATLQHASCSDMLDDALQACNDGMVCNEVAV